MDGESDAILATDTRPKDMPHTHVVRDTSGVLHPARLGSDVPKSNPFRDFPNDPRRLGR